MLFYDPVFLFLFLPLTFALWLIADRYSAGPLRWHILILASLLFYGYFKWDYIFLLLISMTLNYAFAQLVIGARLMSAGTRAKVLLTLAIAVNLGVLGVYKYADFFIVNVNTAFGATFAPPHLVLPLAISFYTFQQIAYLVDVYRDPRNGVSVTEYAFFTSFFPHLIAGPICHNNDIVPQMPKRRTIAETLRDAQVGTVIFAIGLFKKGVLSGLFSPMADVGFAAGAKLDAATAWTSVLAYSLNIYFDFSAYSDMALGLGLLFGIRLPLNFYSPYKASSIIEFWRCWHITLSRFLRDYLYIPLGGSRRGGFRGAINLFIVMLLAGLWHGAAWTFVIWGAIHGFMLIVNHAWRALRGPAGTGAVSYAVGCFVTFVLVTMAWIPFRATSLEQAGKIFMALWRPGAVWPHATENMAVLALGVAVCWFLPNVIQLTHRFDPACTSPPLDLSFERTTPRWLSFQRNWAWAFGIAIMIFGVMHASIGRGVDTFIYFQF